MNCSAFLIRRLWACFGRGNLDHYSDKLKDDKKETDFLSGQLFFLTAKVEFSEFSKLSVVLYISRKQTVSRNESIMLFSCEAFPRYYKITRRALVWQ